MRIIQISKVLVSVHPVGLNQGMGGEGSAPCGAKPPLASRSSARRWGWWGAAGSSPSPDLWSQGARRPRPSPSLLRHTRYQWLRKYVFWPPGSGSSSTRFGSGSGSFCNQAKIVRKNLNSYCFVTPLWLFLSLKNGVVLKSDKQKNL
jgi:hypothetical protein